MTFKLKILVILREQKRPKDLVFRYGGVSQQKNEILNLERSERLSLRMTHYLSVLNRKILTDYREDLRSYLLDQVKYSPSDFMSVVSPQALPFCPCDL
jgi:hypothetical protein